MFNKWLIIIMLTTLVVNISCKKTTSHKNTKPSAMFTIDADNGTTDTVFTFDASGSTDEEDDAADLQIRWDWENDGVWDTDYRTVKVITKTFSEARIYNIVVEVLDSEGLTDFFIDAVNVTAANTAPTAMFTIDPDNGTTDTVFTFDASGSTDDYDAATDLQVRWDWEDDGAWDTNYSTVKTETHQYLIAGTYSVKMEVKDSEDLVTSTWRTIIVDSENTAPTASFTVNPTSGTTDTVFTFDASGSSDNEDATSVLEVRWDWENDGVWDTNYSTVKTATHQYTIVGTYSVKMEVKDSEGLVTSELKTIIVDSGNTAPTAFFTVNPTSGNIGTIFNFDASGSSDNEDATSVLEVRWDWEDDGVWDTNYSTVKTATHQYNAVGIYSVKMEVKDSEGWFTSEWKTVIVDSDNTVPTASFAYQPATPQPAGTTLWFNGDGSSDNEDATSVLTVRWDWENDGVWDTGYGATKIISHVFWVAGTYVVKMEVRDSSGWVNSTTRTVTVTGASANTAPTASFTHQPATPQPAGTTLWFNGSTSIDNEDATSVLTVRWDWTNDGVWDTGYSATKIESHVFWVAGTYVVKMEVRDSSGWVTSTTRTVTVTAASANTAPTASFAYQPATPQVAGTTLWFNGDGSSDNEDATSVLTARWDWTNDGVWDTGYSATKVVSHVFWVAGTYVVKMEIRDSSGWVTSTTRTVTVTAASANTAPTAVISNFTAGNSTTVQSWFDGRTSSDNESSIEWRWDFDVSDGLGWDTAYLSYGDITHQFTVAGTYTVTLEVRDTSGWIHQDTVIVNIL